MIRLFATIIPVILVGCASPVMNYHPTNQQVSHPPIRSTNTVGVGEHMLRQGVSVKSEAFHVTQGVKFRAIIIQPGLYLKMGEDSKAIYYHAINNVTGGANLQAGLISLMYDKKKSTVCTVGIMNDKVCDFGVVGARKDVEVGSEESFQNTLIYNGKIDNKINIGYREFSNNQARAAFNNEVVYDLDESSEIGYKGALLKIISADNKSITYKVLRNFN